MLFDYKDGYVSDVTAVGGGRALLQDDRIEATAIGAPGYRLSRACTTALDNVRLSNM